MNYYVNSHWLVLLIKIYLFISPFIILFLYQKVKNMSLVSINIDKKDLVREAIERSGLDDDIDRLVEMICSEDMLNYTMILDTYGSFSDYEDARMKDFDIMRGYLKEVLSNLGIIVKDISDLLDRLDSHHTEMIDKVVKAKLTQYKNDYSLFYENLKNFIESEEKAHGKHIDEQLREYIERSNEHEKER